MLEKCIKCSFCKNEALAELIYISNGNITVSFFCENHVSDRDFREYEFEISKEEEYSNELPEEFENILSEVGDKTSTSEKFNDLNKEESEELNIEFQIKKLEKKLEKKKERLEKKKQYIIDDLEREMKMAAKNERFNKASEIRDHIKDIKEKRRKADEARRNI